MKKLKSKTQKIYDKARRVSRGFFNRKPTNLRVIPVFFTSAERYFLNVSNYNGLFFIRKNHLRCFLHKAKMEKSLKGCQFVDSYSSELISLARELRIIKPSYSKLYIQTKINLIKILIINHEYGMAFDQINKAFVELEKSKEEFPDYYKADISESDLIHLQRMLDETLEGEE
jgi:hypothetical protein